MGVGVPGLRMTSGLGFRFSYFGACFKSPADRDSDLTPPHSMHDLEYCNSWSMVYLRWRKIPPSIEVMLQVPFQQVPQQPRLNQLTLLLNVSWGMEFKVWFGSVSNQC